MKRTLKLANISTKLDYIAQLAKERPEMKFKTLAHHIDIEMLKEAYRRTNKNGACGVDGQTAKTYAENLDANLQTLLNRFKSGMYKAPPVKRAYIPKADGSNRPIGIPTFEDKILQRAVTMVLEAVYEQDFCNCSYGFRPKRSAHQALQTLRQDAMNVKGGYIIELDIQDFFGSLDYNHLRTFLDQRVVDGVIRRVINKWLKAGVLEDGELKTLPSGTPQGGVISPLLANIYLHEVLDKWFEEIVKPRLKGKASLIRYADDGVLVFEQEEDANRVMEVLPKRFGKYGLTLHPKKTRLIRFTKPKSGNADKANFDKGTSSFDFLGFTHFWAKSRNGYFVIKRKTAKDRFKRAIVALKNWCKNNRHKPIKEQHEKISAKLKGHYGYYGITSNFRSLGNYFHQVRRIWEKWLNRRSQRRDKNWEWFNKLLESVPLPAPHIVHSCI